ncbi:hypothetical protein D3C80_1587980 [compost metagenome]
MDVSIPTPLQLAQCFNQDDPGRLIGQLGDLVVDGFRQSSGDALQVGDGVGPFQGEAFQHYAEGRFTAVGAVVHDAYLVLHAADGQHGLVQIGRPITLGFQKLTQGCERARDIHDRRCSLHAVDGLGRFLSQDGSLVGHGVGAGLGRRGFGAELAVVTHGLQQAP